MPYSTTVHGTIVIGSGAKTIPIPVSTKLPPDTPGTFVFDYTAEKPEDTTHLDVGDFADWVATNIRYQAGVVGDRLAGSPLAGGAGFPDEPSCPTRLH